MLTMKEGPQALDYKMCHYAGSRLEFRGPWRSIPEDFVAFLGSSETFGRYVEHPFVSEFERLTGRASVNFGCLNAGLDSFLGDPKVIALARMSQQVVLQVMQPGNLSNRYYAVHPRRNDRFVKAHAPLKRMFPQLDLTDIAFVGHLLRLLQARSPEKWLRLRRDLQRNWVHQMGRMLTLLDRPVLLLWLDLARDSWDQMVSVDMIAQLPKSGLKTMRVRRQAQLDQIGLQGMVFPLAESRAASRSLSAAYHLHIAQEISCILDGGDG